MYREKLNSFPLSIFPPSSPSTFQITSNGKLHGCVRTPWIPTRNNASSTNHMHPSHTARPSQISMLTYIIHLVCLFFSSCIVGYSETLNVECYISIVTSDVSASSSSRQFALCFCCGRRNYIENNAQTCRILMPLLPWHQC